MTQLLERRAGAVTVTAMNREVIIHPPSKDPITLTEQEALELEYALRSINRRLGAC